MTIGEGRPKIIVPVAARTIDDAAAQAERLAATAGVDVVEFRLDYLGSLLSAGAVGPATRAVRVAAGGKPVLVTLRTAGEGGEVAVADDVYADLCSAVLAHGHADLLDVELFRADAVVRRLVADAHGRNVAVVMSNHDFAGTPPAAELVARLRRMQDAGGDVLKIAVMPRDPGDVLQLLSATWEMHSRHAERPLLTVSMAAVGAVSRVAGEVFGSAATFGTAGTASAPGQIAVAELEACVDVLHRALARG